MKFYYEGHLVRTSKNHIYTHACIHKKEDGTFRLIGCSSTKEGAEKLKTYEVNQNLSGIETNKRAIKALEQGKKGITIHTRIGGGYSFFWKFEKNVTVESLTKEIEEYKEYLDYLAKHWQIVELEARA